MADKTIKTFRRGLVGTFIGLSHVIAGFLSFAWSLARIYIIGWKAVFDYGTGIGIFNYAYEATSLVLWASGIGILRGKRWGKITGAAWAVIVIAFHAAIYFIRKNNWGPFAPAPGWSDFIVIYYALFFIAAQAVNPLAAMAARKLKIDFSFMNRLNLMKKIRGALKN